MRSDQIEAFVANLTGTWFQPPRGMEGAAATEQVAEMARAINATLPNGATSDEIAHALEAAKRSLLRNARSRAWPIIREVVEAVQAGIPKREAMANAAGAAVDHAEEWWRKRGSLPGWWNTEEIVRALIGRRIPARDLWRAGVDVPRDLRDWQTRSAAE